MRVRREVAHLEAEVDRADDVRVKGESVPAAPRLRLEESDRFALLVEEVGRREAANSGADHGDALALWLRRLWRRRGRRVRGGRPFRRNGEDAGERLVELAEALHLLRCGEN